MDLVTFGETMLRLSPPGQERLERATELEFRAAGAESNVAVAAGRLGLETTWLSKLPDSPLGRKVTATLRAQGTEPAVAWSESGRQGVYFLEQAGEPRGTNVVYDRTDAAVTTATPADLDVSRVEAADYFFTSGITPALSATLADTTRDLLARARESGATTALDVNYRSKLWDSTTARAELESLFPHVDVLFVARRDARRVLDREGDAPAIARGLSEDFDFGTVVVTRGEDGAVAFHGGETVEQSVFEAETHDAVGTGDAFVGGYIARRAQGGDIVDALEWGAATAALKRTIPGDVALVTPAEVDAVLDGNTADIDR
ncbi:bifunctional 2-dehydro-3-deoxygluconokinase/2-dehydro-3-deoxygalactonokinase [Halobacterium zhouii]|uniref:bifunctional 2-dehydro-3-deoxygluconokinase/2-dehydro-3- deoxygalactonokinase n=1 Tax=Halobacterium zhouii TaxID=2902624 RepID=UPI001E33C988|nr:bifunctional 2-dehydro-3-deoxygluconokinase/2-dehydro-3-deoxygalactonokinase [Halobacterium zhouii]